MLNVRELYARSNDSGEGTGLCLICETEEIEVALLPCKHFCVCEECFELLPHPKQCPICRSYITTFFKHKKGAAAYGNGQPMTGQNVTALLSTPNPGAGSSSNQAPSPSDTAQLAAADQSTRVTGSIASQRKPWFKKIFSRS